MNDARLESLLYPPPTPASFQRPPPDWVQVHQEMKRKSVTLFLLWQEYKAQSPDGFQYSRFCELYREFTGKLSVSMRQTHVAGEKLFFDYAGPAIPIVDRTSGEPSSHRWSVSLGISCRIFPLSGSNMEEKGSLIRTGSDGAALQGVFYLRLALCCTTRSGKPYWKLHLTDCSGCLDAYLWNQLTVSPRQDSVIWVSGQGRRLGGKLICDVNLHA